MTTIDVQSIDQLQKSKTDWVRHFTHKFAHLLLLLADTYGIISTGLLILWLLIGEGIWVSQMFVSLLPGIIVPVPILFIAGLIIRRLRLIGLTILPALAFIAMYASFFLPHPATVENVDDILKLSLMTYNTQAEFIHLEDMAVLIWQMDADVIALQELSEEAAAFFQTDLADDYPYQATHTFGHSVLGKGVLSRHPIITEALDGHPERDFYQRVEIRVQEIPVTIYNTHLMVPRWGAGFDSSGRHDDAVALLNQANAEDGAVILLGDFNLTDQTEDYRLLAADYVDSHREVGRGLGLSFPNFRRFPFPFNTFPLLIRLDYVFHSDHFIGIDTRIASSSAGSDHHPMMATLGIAVQ